MFFTLSALWYRLWLFALEICSQCYFGNFALKDKLFLHRAEDLPQVFFPRVVMPPRLMLFICLCQCFSWLVGCESELESSDGVTGVTGSGGVTDWNMRVWPCWVGCLISMCLRKLHARDLTDIVVAFAWPGKPPAIGPIVLLIRGINQTIYL